MPEVVFITPRRLHIETLPAQCSNIELAQAVYGALICALMQGDNDINDIFETVVSTEHVVHTAQTCIRDVHEMNGSVFGLIAMYAKAIICLMRTQVHEVPSVDVYTTATQLDFHPQYVNITIQ